MPLSIDPRNDPDPLKRIFSFLGSLVGIGPGKPPEDAPIVEPITATPPPDSILGLHGFTQELPPELQRVMQSPFFQDTVRKFMAERGVVGVAEEPPDATRMALGFVDPKLQHRIHITPLGLRRSSERGLENTLLHEGVHTATTPENEELLDLMVEMESDYNMMLRRVTERQGRVPMIQLNAAVSPREHVAYAVELGMDWIRGGRDPERLKVLKETLPGIEKAIKFIEQRLGEETITPSQSGTSDSRQSRSP